MVRGRIVRRKLRRRVRFIQERRAFLFGEELGSTNKSATLHFLGVVTTVEHGGAKTCIMTMSAA